MKSSFYKQKGLRNRKPFFHIKSRHLQKKCRLDAFGAGDEARTRYLHLGKVALYRMSYTRMGFIP